MTCHVNTQNEFEVPPKQYTASSPVWSPGHSKLLLMSLVELLQMPLLPVTLLLRKPVRHRPSRGAARRVRTMPAATLHARAAGALRRCADVLGTQMLLPRLSAPAQRLQHCRRRECRGGCLAIRGSGSCCARRVYARPVLQVVHGSWCIGQSWRHPRSSPVLIRLVLLPLLVLLPPGWVTIAEPATLAQADGSFPLGPEWRRAYPQGSWSSPDPGPP